MPTNLVDWFNDWCYNVHTQSNFTTPSAAISVVLSDYTYNYYMPVFNIEYKFNINQKNKN